MFAKDVRREIFNRAVSIQKPGRRLAADAGNAGIAVRRIADEPEQIRDERRIDPEFFADAGSITNDFAPPIDLHHPCSANALPEVLVGRPDGDLLHLFIFRCDVRRRCQRIIRFELDHRPHHNAHRRERFLERMELRQQRPLDPRAGLVTRPKPIPK